MAPNAPQPLPVILQTEDVMPTCARHIAEHRSLTEKIIGSVVLSTATFESVVLPLEELENAQSGEKAIIDALKYCAASLTCQTAAEAAQDVFRAYYSSAMRREMYILLQAVNDRKECLDPESQKLLDHRLRDYAENGFDKLNDAEIQHRQKRSNRIEKLCTEYCRNVRTERGGEWFTPQEVYGLPERDQEPVGDDGKAFYSYANKQFDVMSRARDPKTHRQMAEGAGYSCAKNVPIFREVMLLRDENARQLGAANHASTKLPYRLAESLEWLDHFLNDVANTLIPAARAEHNNVAAERRRSLKEEPGEEVPEDDNTMPPWDYLYYSTKRDDKVLPIDHAAIAEYFPLHHTFTAMLALFADYLQLCFDPIAPRELATVAWHQDVQGWAVWDERQEHKDEFIGYLFADLLERPHKYRGNQSVNLQPGYVRPDGTRVYPSNTLMCNFHLSPTKAYPLSHMNLITMFHELGHSIHDIISRTRYARFHGYNVPRELAEGNGMMLEQWCWLPDVLRQLSWHYTRVDQSFKEVWHKEHPGEDLPPERIPESHIAQRIARRPGNIRSNTLGLLVLVLFDLMVHSPPSREAPEKLDFAAAFNAYSLRIKSRGLPKNALPHTAVTTLFDGYDAGFYAYTCAQVLALDFFATTFAADPLSRAAWQKFREGIMEPGGSRDERTLVKEFLGGRSMDASALYSLLGLKK
ncbi:metallopeptidase MepB [Sporothrix schenckii 1099-18]|uniref:Metallopeptidase MepB n=1 Tax=Sporothrix schenckii 1099-18 TaxID=1397361 RepID=A0A0F2MAX1_SPOSC|nr:metallopeptidase MepB [Sporothrix schenckii 1099-18]KJR86848.1 metallopeptidase MepB [Sporothrix schenckii 1099-18]